MLSWVWAVVLKLIPLEKILPGGGQKELSLEQLNRVSSMSIRREHNSHFFKQQSVVENRRSVIEDKGLPQSAIPTVNELD